MPTPPVPARPPPAAPPAGAPPLPGRPPLAAPPVAPPPAPVRPPLADPPPVAPPLPGAPPLGDPPLPGAPPELLGAPPVLDAPPVFWAPPVPGAPPEAEPPVPSGWPPGSGEHADIPRIAVSERKNATPRPGPRVLRLLVALIIVLLVRVPWRRPPAAWGLPFPPVHCSVRAPRARLTPSDKSMNSRGSRRRSHATSDDPAPAALARVSDRRSAAAPYPRRRSVPR